MRKSIKKYLSVAGVVLAGVLVMGTFLYAFYEKEVNKNQISDFVPPPSFQGNVEAVDIENNWMTVTMEEKRLILDCERDAYKLYNTKPGDRVTFRCEEEELEDEVVKVWHFDREEE